MKAVFHEFSRLRNRKYVLRDRKDAKGHLKKKLDEKPGC